MTDNSKVQLISMEKENYGTITENSEGVSPEAFKLLEIKRRTSHCCYFRDGVRQIDAIIAWEEDIEDAEKKASGDTEKADSEEAKLRGFRAQFEKNLAEVGVQTEEETEDSEKKRIHYIKLYIPWDVMCYYAEDLALRAPLQVQDNPDNNWSQNVLKKLHIPNFLAQKVPNKPSSFNTSNFKKSKLSKFLGSSDQKTFFKPTDRHQVAFEILATQVYGLPEKAEIGIDRLINEGAYTAAFPLHDGEFELPTDKSFPDENLNQRQILYKFWGKWSKIFKYQPLDHVREYYGEKVAIYFAWLGLYTAWLLPISIVGLIVFLYGIITINANLPAQEICNSGTDFKMCPICSEDIGCEYWYLSGVCLQIKISYLFDHPGTVFYAIFVALWAVTFLENWKRKNAEVAHHWDVMDYTETEERPRPEYSVLCTTYEANPVTGVMEPHFPKEKRLPRVLTATACITIMISVVIIFIISVILYRLLIAIPLSRNTTLRPRTMLVAGITSAMLNLILIMIMGQIYEVVANKLTQWEMHRTQTEFEDSFTFKVFLFQFVNFYSSIFYIAFFKGRFVGYPGHYITFFGLRNEQCDNGGCLIELAQQLVVIMIGKQIINNFQEIIVPKLKTWFQRFQSGISMQDTKVKKEIVRWSEDYKLIKYEGLFEEYLEMVLQFGFITIFVAAFPLAPFFALLNNWFEIRLDASKLVCDTRRPVAERAQNIGIWFTILDTLVQLSILSNAFLIAFTSEFLPRQLYKYNFKSDLTGYAAFTLSHAPPNSTSQACLYTDFRDTNGDFTKFYWQLLAGRLAFVICFEHVVFFIGRMLDLLIPDIPHSLEIKIKREQYLAKQALQEI